MATEFKLPELGENIKSGVITKVLVTVGATVAKDQPVLEMETDKAVVEVPSSVAGTVTAVHVKDGDKAAVGQLIFTVAAAGASAPPAPTEQPKKAKPQAPAPAVPAPQAPAPAEGPAPAPVAAASPGVPVAAAPSVRQFAREIGIEISRVPAGSPDGRITIDDVKRYAKQINESRAAGGPAAPEIRLPDFSKWGAIERQAMTAVRRKTAEHMALAWSQIPHVTQFDNADITGLEERRKKLSPKVEKTGAKLTVTAILIKIVAAALKVFPKFNASIDAAKGEIILKKYVNIGVAVDTDRGLLVPVVKEADRKNIVQIAVELAQMAEKARAGKLALDEMQGGSFTVTNLGGIGGTHFTPIVNFPEVAILGVGRAKMEPHFGEKDGCCSPKLVLPLSLSYDHRLIDGADGARFLRWVVEAIEEPLLIPLEG